MKFRRLKVSNYKGIRSIEVEFPPTGITLIHGQNESGKSSLMQAINTLFDKTKTKPHVSVAHLTPKDGSGYPDILLEAESGGHHFTFRKCYGREKLAELTIHNKGGAFHSGMEAQERLEAILDSTTDRTLWNALQLQQGSAVGLANLKDQTALFDALDKAVAGSGLASVPESLFAKVEREYGAYYNTGNDNELLELKTLRSEAAAAAAEVANCEKQIADLGKKTKEAIRLRLAAGRLRDSRKTQEDLFQKAEERVAEVEVVERTLHPLKVTLAQTWSSFQNAKREHDTRRERIDSEKEARDLAAKAGLETAGAMAAEAATAALMARKKSRLDVWYVRHLAREGRAALLANDAAYFRDAADLERLRTGWTLVEVLQAEAREAKAELGRNKMTAQALREITEADTAVVKARATLEGSAPALRLQALADCAVVVDGQPLTLAGGETQAIVVTETVKLEVPRLLLVEVTTGAGNVTPREALRKAEEALALLLAPHGVADAAEASLLAEKRRKADDVIAGHKKNKKEHLVLLGVDPGKDDVPGRVAELETAQAEYVRTRAAEPVLASDSAAVAGQSKTAAIKLARTAERQGAAKTAYQSADAAWRAAMDRRIHCGAEQKVADRNLEQAADRLREQRAAVSDEDMAKRRDDAEQAHAKAAAAVAGLEQKLNKLNPEPARQRVDALKSGLGTIDKDIQTNRDKLLPLEGELRALGGDGWNEKLDEARSLLDYRERKLRAALRRAGAAKLLYSTIKAARALSQKDYIIPLKNKLEDLARNVYDRPVTVAVDEKLQIVSRTLDGKTIDFLHLSGGTQEQFSLMHRAVCSLIVAADGGAPLVFDDALGYSDNDRLCGMNLVFKHVARHCQLIILTCMPERFNLLAPAKLIHLSAGAILT